MGVPSREKNVTSYVSAEQNPCGSSSQDSNGIAHYQIDEDVLFTSLVDNEMLFGHALVDGPYVLDDT